jgi:hypothetical protein
MDAFRLGRSLWDRGWPVTAQSGRGESGPVTVLSVPVDRRDETRLHGTCRASPGRGLHDPGSAGAEFRLPIRPAELPLAPNRLHKDNVSGGPPYGLILLDGSAAGLFAAETTMPFGSHLNWVFSHGGFAGRTAPHNQWQMKQSLARDLLPLCPVCGHEGPVSAETLRTRQCSPPMSSPCSKIVAGNKLRGRYLARAWRVLDRRCHERGDVPQRGAATRPRCALLT